MEPVSLTPTEAEAGQPLDVSAWWQPQQAPLPDAVIAWQWFDPTGAEQSAGVLEPPTNYPVAQWGTNSAFRNQLTLPAPAQVTQAGAWRVRVYLARRAAPHAALSNAQEAEVALQPGQRQFSAPQLDVTLGHDFAGQITLLGIARPPEPLLPGSSLPITVVWQAETAPPVAYTGFVHLLVDGRVAAQDDHAPQRVTTAWLPGEVTLDRYTLAVPAELPAGTYTLEIGLYDAAAPGAPRPAPPAVLDVVIGER